MRMYLFLIICDVVYSTSLLRVQAISRFLLNAVGATSRCCNCAQNLVTTSVLIVLSV